MSNNTFCLIFILAFLNASQQRCPMCTCDGKREQSEIVIYGTEHTDWYRLCLQYVANINICLRYSDCVCKFTLVLSSVHTGVWSSISQPIFGPLQPWSRLWGPKQSCSPYIYNILLLQPNSWFTSYWRPILMKEWPLNNSWTTPGSMWVFQLIVCVSLDIFALHIQGSNTEMFCLAIHGGSPNASPYHKSADRRQRDVGRGQGEHRLLCPIR